MCSSEVNDIKLSLGTASDQAFWSSIKPVTDKINMTDIVACIFNDIAHEHRVKTMDNGRFNGRFVERAPLNSRLLESLMEFVLRDDLSVPRRIRIKHLESFDYNPEADINIVPDDEKSDGLPDVATPCTTIRIIFKVDDEVVQDVSKDVADTDSPVKKNAQ